MANLIVTVNKILKTKFTTIYKWFIRLSFFNKHISWLLINKIFNISQKYQLMKLTTIK